MSAIEIAWTVVGIVVPILVGTGLTAVGLTPPEFKLARGCFWISAIVLGGMDVVWYVQTGHSIWWRAVVSGLIGAAIAILLPEGLRWVSQRESGTNTQPPPSTAKVATNREEVAKTQPSQPAERPPKSTPEPKPKGSSLNFREVPPEKLGLPKPTAIYTVDFGNNFIQAPADRLKNRVPFEEFTGLAWSGTIPLSVYFSKNGELKVSLQSTMRLITLGR